jgi:hypothetical protein
MSDLMAPEFLTSASHFWRRWGLDRTCRTILRSFGDGWINRDLHSSDKPNYLEDSTPNHARRGIHFTIGTLSHVLDDVVRVSGKGVCC